MKRFFPLLGVVALLSPGAVMAANFQTFDDPNLFSAALAGGAADITELFNSPTTVQIDTSTGVVLNGSYWDVLVFGQTSTLSLTGSTLYGAGGYFDLSPNDFGTGLQISVQFPDNSIENVALLKGQTGFSSGFFGFISDTAFSTIILSTTNIGGVKETFSIDNLQLETTGLSGPVNPGGPGTGDPGTGGDTGNGGDSGGGDDMEPVPEPSTIVLSVIGLAGLAGWKRMRRS